MTHGSEWDMEIWRPEVKDVTWGRSPSVTFSTEGRHISMSHERLCVICFVVWPRWAYKMAAWEICLQDNGKARFWEFYPQEGGVGVLPTKWRCFWELYPQDGAVEVLPTRWRRFWQFQPQDGGAGDLPTRWRRFGEFYPQDGGVGELPTWWRQCKTNKM